MIDSTIPPGIEALNGELRQLAVETWHAACRLPVACDAWSAWYQELRTVGDADPRVLRRASETVLRCVECIASVIRPDKAREMRELADKLPHLPLFKLQQDELLDPKTGETLRPAYAGWQNDVSVVVNFYGDGRSDPLDCLVGCARHLRKMLKESPASFLSGRDDPTRPPTSPQISQEKPKKKRRHTHASLACIRLYKKRRKTDPSESMQSVVKWYVDEKSTNERRLSFSSIYRILNDQSDDWSSDKSPT